MSEDLVFTVDQIAACNTALRTALGLRPEHVSTEKFVAMISEEIEQLRGQGWTDAEIADLVAESTGSVISADEIGRFYAPVSSRALTG